MIPLPPTALATLWPNWLMLVIAMPGSKCESALLIQPFFDRSCHAVN